MLKPLLVLALVGGLAGCDHGGVSPSGHVDAGLAGRDAGGKGGTTSPDFDELAQCSDMHPE